MSPDFAFTLGVIVFDKVGHKPQHGAVGAERPLTLPLIAALYKVLLTHLLTYLVMYTVLSVLINIASILPIAVSVSAVSGTISAVSAARRGTNARQEFHHDTSRLSTHLPPCQQQRHTFVSILLLKPQVSVTEGCRWWAWLAGRGRHTVRCQPARSRR